MSERDIIYGAFYQNMPCNVPYGSPNFYGMPGNYNPIESPENLYNGNFFNNITNRIDELEDRIKFLEDKIKNSVSNQYQDDDSLYMI